MAATRFDHARFPEPVAHFEKIFGRLRFNFAGWAQVNCCFLGPDNEPSLSLHRDGGFNCFACGAHGGDILEFEHLRSGRDRRAIAQDWGAWSGSRSFERPKTRMGSSRASPGDCQGPCREAQAHSPSFSRLARLNFERHQGRGASPHATWLQRPCPGRQGPARQWLAEQAASGRTTISSVSSSRACSTASCRGPISAFASTPSRPAMRPTRHRRRHSHRRSGRDRAVHGGCPAAHGRSSARRHHRPRRAAFLRPAASRAALRASSGPTRTEA